MIEIKAKFKKYSKYKFKLRFGGKTQLKAMFLSKTPLKLTLQGFFDFLEK